MAFRKNFVRRSLRGSRRKTRWFALTPHAMTFAGNDTWDSQKMEIQDDQGAYNWGNLVGATILRTLVDIVIEPTYPDGGVSPYSYIGYMHLGFGVQDASAPAQDRWDPNVPHASFMWRHMQRYAAYERVDSVGRHVHWSETKDGNLIIADSTQKRKIGEADALWMFGHFFAPTTAHAAAIGYTGRVLIALP